MVKSPWDDVANGDVSRYLRCRKNINSHHGVAEYGTLVTIQEIAQEYDNGEMDIITNGTIVFRILEIIKKIPDKLYSGAIVNYPENAEVYHRKELMQVVIKAIRELHRILNISKDFRKPDEELNAYDLAHHAGLSMEEEY